jgi:hypothetical protein
VPPPFAIATRRARRYFVVLGVELEPVLGDIPELLLEPVLGEDVEPVLEPVPELLLDPVLGDIPELLLEPVLGVVSDGVTSTVRTSVSAEPAKLART